MHAKSAMPPTVVSLIGYRCSGKTTVGKLLAERLGWEFSDADNLVRELAGCEIAEIFRSEGESVFRDWEEQAIAALVQRSPLVLSVGGGAVMRPANAKALTKAGVVCWLTASVDEIVERLGADQATLKQRPALTSMNVLKEVSQVLAERESVYRSCATFSVDTDGKTPAEVADEIVVRLQLEDKPC